MNNFLLNIIIRTKQKKTQIMFLICALYLLMHLVFSVHLYEIIFYIMISVAISFFLLDKLYDGYFEKQKVETILPVCVSTIFFAFSLVLILNHEVWLDEAQTFLLVRESKNLIDIFFNTKNEGHPLLWHILIFPVVHAFNAIEAVQIFHVIFSSASIYILFKYSPFSSTIKILLLCNFYILYEYNIISRNYSISVLIIFLLCALYYSRYRFTKTYGILIFLLANTNAMGLVISFSFIFVEFIEYLQRKTNRKAQHIIFVIGLFGVLLCLLQILRADVEGKIPTLEVFDDFKLRKAILFSFFPIPDAVFSFWGTNFINNTRNFYFLSIFLYTFITIIFLIRLSVDKEILYRFLAMMLMLFVFFTHVYNCSPRHHGFILLSFIAMEWVLENNSNFKSNNKFIHMQLNLIFTSLFSFVLFLQSIYGICACYMDYKYEFSCTKKVSNILTGSNYSSLEISSYPDFLAIGVMAYSGKREFYNPQSKSINNYIQWGEKRDECKNLMQAYKDVKERAITQSKKIIFLTNEQLPEFCEEKLLFKSENQLCPDETFGRNIYVYIVNNL